MSEAKHEFLARSCLKPLIGVLHLMEIRDELPDGDELVEHLVGDGVVGVLCLVVLEDGEPLVVGAA